MIEPDLFVALESPPFHRLEFGGANRFAGLVFDARDVRIPKLRVSIDGSVAGEFPADLPSEEAGSHFSRLASTKRCRFDFSVFVPDAADIAAVEAIDETGARRPLFEYDLAEVRERSEFLRRASRSLGAAPAPPPGIVFQTQGHRDVHSYQDSILPGLVNQLRYLAASGADPASIRSILDFGCGSGRLLLGWWLDGVPRDLFGCDVNAELISWAGANLPPALRFERTAPEPPLPFADARFDLVDAVSVWTHLGHSAQKRWAGELARILRPGGVALITAHGEPYVRLFFPERRADFEQAGHFEVPTGDEGSNRFASFHSPAGIREVFAGFRPLGFFPSGAIGQTRILFPLAAFQDVYVLKKES